MPATPAQVRERVAKLRREIEHHRYLYHVLDRQEISDAALDSLKHELAQLETRYPELITPDSPTQRVGGRPLPELRKVAHRQRMLSLEDAFSAAELEAWETRWRKLTPRLRPAYLVDLKLDGLAISLRFHRGLFTVGATRGDGVTGEEVTQNLKTIESIPLRLRTDDLTATQRRVVETGDIEVRGEVVMLRRDFESLNRAQRKAGLPEFANPRNVAAGSIRQLDPKLAASRKLQFYAWELVTDLGQATLEGAYALLRRLGVRVNPKATFCTSLDEVVRFHERVGRERERLPFWIDGLVVKLNDRQAHRDLGVVGKTPRAAVAFKFPAEQVTTVVEDIQVQVGRTGALTPVAHLRPVQVAGTTVARATLHNADEVARLDVRVGDTVVIQKAGDIIPDVVQVLMKLRPKSAHPFRMPTHCPVCRHPIHRAADAAIHYCSNVHCPARERESLYHFASKKALNIDGLGPNTIDVLVDEGLVKTPADFFTLKPADLEGLPLFAEKKAQNLVQAIAAAKRVTLARFIFGLGIRHVGEQTAIDMAQHFQTVGALMQANVEALTQVPNVGAVVAESVAGFFRNEQHRRLIHHLQRNLTISSPGRPAQTTLRGKTFVVTGTLSAMSRDDAQAKIRAAGGTVSSTVSRKTTYVVVGEHPGSKAERARQLGVPILTERQLLAMLE